MINKIRYDSWGTNVKKAVASKEGSFTLSELGRELGLKEKDRKLMKIASVYYQLMKLVNEGLLVKVGKFYVMAKRLTYTKVRALFAYAKNVLRKFKKHCVGYEKQAYNKRFYAAKFIVTFENVV